MIKANVLKGGLREKNVLKKNNASDEPLISIITPVLNNEKYIQECLNSLHGQIYTNYEHIIIDGGSSDKTLEIIKTNEEKIDFWTSKKDKGIYGIASKDDLKELSEEGIDTQSIPWVEDKNN